MRRILLTIVVSYFGTFNFANADAQSLQAYYHMLFADLVAGKEVGIKRLDEYAASERFRAIITQIRKTPRLHLVGTSDELCLMNSLIKECWSVSQKKGRVTISFKVGKETREFIPSLPSDMSRTTKEFEAFLKKRTEVSNFPLLDLIIERAYAAESDLTEKWDKEISSWKASYKGLIAASAAGWQFLPENPSTSSVELFAKNAKDRLKPFMTNDSLRCKPVTMELKRQDGRPAKLKTEDGENFVIEVSDSGSTEFFRASYVQPKQQSSGDGARCGLVYCTHYVPGQFLNLEKCESSKTCRRIEVYHHDFDPDYIIRSMIGAVRLFGNGPSEIAKFEKFSSASEKEKSFDKFKSLYGALGDKYEQGLNELQSQMMLASQVHKICGSNEMQKVIIKETGVEFNSNTGAK